MNDLNQEVIALHDIARSVERVDLELGLKIRQCADQLSQLIKQRERLINETIMG